MREVKRLIEEGDSVAAIALLSIIDYLNLDPNLVTEELSDGTIRKFLVLKEKSNDQEQEETR